MCFSPTVPGDASRFPNTAAPTCTPVDDSTLRYAIVLAIIFVWSDFKILYIKSEFGCFLKEENPDTSVSFLGMGGPADTRNSGSRAPVRVRATGGSAADNRKWCNFLLPAGWPSRGETAGEGAGYVVLRSRVLGSWPRAGDGAARRRPRAAALLALRVQRRVRPRSRSPSRALLTALGCAVGLRLWVACPLGPSLGSRCGRPVGSEAAGWHGSPASAAGELPGGTQR